MIYGTYLGGSGYDRGYRIAVDTAGAAHVTGFTDSADFPTMNPLQPALGGPDWMHSCRSSVRMARPSSTPRTWVAGQMTRRFAASMGITVDLTGATYVTGTDAIQRFPAR